MVDVSCGEGYKQKGDKCVSDFLWNVVIPVSLTVVGLVASLYLWRVWLPKLLRNWKLRRCEQLLQKLPKIVLESAKKKAEPAY